MKRIISYIFAIVVALGVALQSIPKDNYYANENLFFSLYDKLSMDDSYDRIIDYSNDLYRFDGGDTLKVMLEKDAPGIFKYNGGYYGYMHDIFNEYCYSIGKTLKIIESTSQFDILHSLQSDSIAFGIIMTPDIELNSRYRKYLIAPLQDSSKYVVLANKKSKTKDIKDISNLLDTSKTLFKRGAKQIDALAEYVVDYLSDTTEVKNRNTYDDIAMLRNKSYDFVVCREVEAYMYCYNYKNIVQTYMFSQYVYSMLITSAKNKILYKEFVIWLNEFKKSDNYRQIVDYYQNDGYIKNFLNDGFLTPIRSISHLDDIFRKKSKNSPFDWKFIAAIGYVESKFSPVDISHRGAVGVMQILPRIAKHYGVNTIEELKQPSVNISLSVKILSENLKLLRLRERTINDDALKIILACYNGGYGHISDAMRLAKKYGENERKWNIVEKYLKTLSDSTYYTQKDVVKSGRFNSDETITFVNKVMAKYDEYKKHEVK